LFEEKERQHPIEDWDRPDDFGYQLLIDANPRSTPLLVLKSLPQAVRFGLPSWECEVAGSNPARSRN
jgi:hypothetical protein